jgi:ATP-dependent helicase HrpB
MRFSVPDLPIRAALPDLRGALARGHGVLSAPPGSGKTTVVPLALLDEPWLTGRRVLMLEPRRLAARAAAARMAELAGGEVGGLVGYQVRFERRISPGTRVEVLTEGVLTRRLQSDPELEGVGLLIFDEFHERSLHADLALALALDVVRSLRPDLRVLVMSATLDAEPVSALLGSAAVVRTGGRQYPVEVRYLAQPCAGPLPAAAERTVRRVLAEEAGDVLVFLPGGGEIRGLLDRLRDGLPDGCVGVPLYGDLPKEAQDLAIRPRADGRRRVVGPQPPRDGEDLAGLRRPAGRARRAPRPRGVLPPLDGIPAPRHGGTPTARDPDRRPRAARARVAALGGGRSGCAGLARHAAGRALGAGHRPPRRARPRG